MQHRSGAHRRQLGRIAHQQQLAGVGQGLQQGRHQGQIHHRQLIDDQQVEGEGMAAVAAEAVAAALQQPVQGGAGGLAQPFGQGPGQPLAALLQGAAQPGRRLAGGGGQVQPQLGP